jgi:hypothetical protein
MTSGTRTAFSALASLDPLRSLRTERGSRQPDAAAATVELQIARILAVPRGDEADHGAVRPVPGPTARPTPRPTRRARPRYGALGLLASAALAVIASLLWVSPSAGEPVGRAGVVHVGVIHHHGEPGTTAITSIR